MKAKTKTKTKKRRVKKQKFPPITSSETVIVTAFTMCMAVFSDRWVEPATKLFCRLSDTEQIATMAIGDKIMAVLNK